MMNHYKIKNGSIIHLQSCLRGGMFHLPSNVNTPEGLMATLSTWSTKLHELQAEKENLKNEVGRGTSNKGIRKVIQSGSKELVPKKFQSVGQSGSFMAWAREVKDYARMADPTTLELFRLGESLDEVWDLNTDIPKELEELDKDLHYFIARFLDGETKLLSLNAEIGELDKEHKSGSESWRLLIFNYEKKSAYNVVSVVEMI